jgi:hypothetical protein
MCNTRRHLAAAACVLLLNLQLFAANALGCVHESAAAAAVAGCPHLGGALPPTGEEPPPPATGDDPVPSTAVEPCQKCNLGKVAGGWHLVSAPLHAVAQENAPLPQAKLSLHPSAPASEGPLRPPRSISG